MADRNIIVKILDLARWAPSGDNTQPWRFEIVADHHVAVHGHDTRDWCLYDLDGHASHMAHGALLETIRVAATAFGLESSWELRGGGVNSTPIYDVTFSPAPSLGTDPLVSCIESRTVQRRPMRTTALTPDQKAALERATGPAYRVQFFESLPERWSVAKLLWASAYIRLTCPEAYEVHREIIEWGARFSEDRIPEQAVGVDPATAKLMRWVMESWSRVEFFNRYLLGTVAPRIQLDLIPAIACAAHLLIRPEVPLQGIEGHVRLGMAMQRVWLTATSVGLQLQPEMTPVIFRWYARARRSISRRSGIDEGAVSLACQFERMACAGPEDTFGFFGRVGVSPVPHSRSVRKALDELWHKED